MLNEIFLVRGSSLQTKKPPRVSERLFLCHETVYFRTALVKELDALYSLALRYDIKKRG